MGTGAKQEAMERDLRGHIVVARQSWVFAQQWAGALSDTELRQAVRLRIVGDAGLAVEQERNRRRKGGGDA